MSRLSKGDPNSYSEPENIVLKHVDLFWNVDFDKQTISGEAVYHFNIVAKEIERIVSLWWKDL